MKNYCQKKMRNFMFLFVLFTVIFSSAAIADGRRIINGHVRKEISSAPRAGDMPLDRDMVLSIGLPLRDRAGLGELIKQLYDRTSPLYHKFITPEQFAASYGPAEKDYMAVRDFCKNNGLRIIAAYTSRALLVAGGAAKDVQKAFNVKFSRYLRADGSEFYAAENEPSVGANMPELLHISGMDNYDRQTHNSGAFSGGTPAYSGGSGTGGGFLSADLRHAYCAGVAMTGAGQSIGLAEFDGFLASDLNLFMTSNGWSSMPTVTTVLCAGYSGTPGSNEVEVDIDLDAAIDMAPGAASIVSVEGTNDAAGADAVYASLASPPNGVPLCKQISSSWMGFTYSLSNIAQAVAQYAAQGQSFFQCSGDNGFYYSDPSDARDGDYTTLCGGTELNMTAGGAVYTGESVWCAVQASQCSGGGILNNVTIPSYQSGLATVANLGSSVYRNAPDVAMSANGVMITKNGAKLIAWGTSISAPLWAGFMALVNQQAEAQTGSDLGFINPAIYAIGKGPNYSNDFHDVNDSSTNGKYPAVAGYDLSTGWGSPKGRQLIDDLIGCTYTSTPTKTFSSTPTYTVTPTNTAALSSTFTPTRTITQTFTQTQTQTATQTVTQTSTEIGTPTQTNTDTPDVSMTDTPVYTPTQTFTVTPTSTFEDTATQTDTPTPADTATPSNTATAASTRTQTPGDTATPTLQPSATVTAAAGENLFKINDVVIYPNPMISGHSGPNLRLDITGKPVSITMKIYTVSFRLIADREWAGADITGGYSVSMGTDITARLAPGIYYYIIKAKDASGRKSASRIGMFVAAK
jgi:subtilase family serine protease